MRWRPLVFTLARDPSSAQERHERQSNLYYLDDCTAFEELFGHHDCFMFCPSEDLKTLYGNRRYRNPTPDFWQFYRSTLVLPIRSPREPDATPPHLVVGFLCLDCKDAGKFCGDVARRNLRDMPEQFNLAASVADDLFWPLLAFTARVQRPGPPPMPYVNTQLLLNNSEVTA
jgi:hypothetical protein